MLNGEGQFTITTIIHQSYYHHHLGYHLEYNYSRNEAVLLKPLVDFLKIKYPEISKKTAVQSKHQAESKKLLTLSRNISNPLF